MPYILSRGISPKNVMKNVSIMMAEVHADFVAVTIQTLVAR